MSLARRARLLLVALSTAALLPLTLPNSASAATPGPVTSSPAPAEQDHVLAVPDEPDEDFVEECEKDEEANSEQGRVWNRRLWCQHTTSTGEFYLDGRPVGGAEITFTAVAHADPQERRVRVFFRVDDFETYGIVNSFSDMRIRVGCQAGCTVTNRDDEEDTWENHWLLTWRDLMGWASWDIESDPALGVGTDKLSRHFWQFTGQLSSAYGNTTVPGVGRQHWIRCDSATYFRGAPRACINDDVVPFLTYSKSDVSRPADGYVGTAGVARHIEAAQNTPSQTYPNYGSPKTIPGKFTGVWTDPGLHRVPYKGSVWSANQLEKNRVRDHVAPYNGPDDLPPKPDAPVDADEYPFATTQEGAGQRDGTGAITGNFSVQWVDSQENRKAGRQLRDFYRTERILYGNQDEFYVRIVP
ncbi:hypothetical protein [Streptomyces sp. NPDC090994]|uniref:NucA/NucB deoxyribonuclease domain-containing protein n=1 Tax=Streptomyces sp. NPDC090994 TaxID=3365969 RepID=UPI0037F86750